MTSQPFADTFTQVDARLRAECPDRVSRLMGLLATRDATRFVTSDPRDIQYLTGVADPRGTLIVEEDGRCVLVAPAAAADEDTVMSGGISVVAVPFGHDEGPVVATLLTGRHATVVDTASAAVRGALLSVTDAVIEWPDLGLILRRATTAPERAMIRLAVSAAEAGVAAVVGLLTDDVSELDLAAAAANAMIVAGGARQWFDSCVATGARSSFPDARPTMRRCQAGDIGFIDVGPLVGGYSGDLTRSFAIGQPPIEATRVLDGVIALQRRVAAVLLPGVAARDLWATAAAALADGGWPFAMPHHLGHGLGVLGACPPWLRPDSDDVLLEHDFVALEPGVYLRGTFGARHEDVYEITGDGPERVSTLPQGWFEPSRGWVDADSARV